MKTTRFPRWAEHAGISSAGLAVDLRDQADLDSFNARVSETSGASYQLDASDLIDGVYYTDPCLGYGHQEKHEIAYMVVTDLDLRHVEWGNYEPEC